MSVRLGDLDGDGDLDVAYGREQGFTVYRAEGSTMVAVWYGSDQRPPFVTRSNVDWMDQDGDGDLDLVVGHCTVFFNARCDPAAVRIYENLGGGLANGWIAPTVGRATSVAAADVDHDGHADLVVGSEDGPLRLYSNSGTTLSLAWTSVENEQTSAVAWLPQRP